jgi:phospholipid-transporting ATPase
MQLDGETNLKIKKAPDQTKHFTLETVGNFRGRVRCEPPNSRLYQFTGNLEFVDPVDGLDKVLAISPAAVLLRGCSLRNTNRLYGLVIYAG